MNRKTITIIIKIILSLGIVGYLVYDAARTKNVEGKNVFEMLLQGEKHWGLLAAGLGAFSILVLLSFVRWWFLVRALGVPARFLDTMRVACWGFLFNLAPLGIVGGDLVKAVMLGREHRGKQASVVASVIVDRIIGLYVLFVYASVAILLTGFRQYHVTYGGVEIIGRICNGVFIVTGVGTAGIAAILLFDKAVGRLVGFLHRVPRVGLPLAHLLEDIRLYRHRLPTLLIATLLTVGVHSSAVASYYFTARGLPGNVPPPAVQFVIVPLTASAGVVPLPMGPGEAVLDFFYKNLPLGLSILPGQGLLIVLANRLQAILLAAIGVLFAMGKRAELAEAMHTTEPPPEGESSD